MQEDIVVKATEARVVGRKVELLLTAPIGGRMSVVLSTTDSVQKVVAALNLRGS